MRDAEKIEKVKAILTRGHVAEVISDSDICELLISRQLRVKWGTDPTSKNIHLGRSIPIMMLRDLQELGHQIVIVIGDFTAEIGDTSDKESERPAINSAVVKSNMGTYIDQIGLILDLEKTEFVFNSSWWKSMPFGDFIELTNLFSLAEFSARSNIAKRLKSGNRVSVREVIYPIMQGYDSEVLKADIEIGGSDQRYNMIAGRKIQRAFNSIPQSLIITNLIDGLDGRKMSSSWGNTINITDSPDEMFGKLMSMSDELIIPYFIHLTRIPVEKINAADLCMKRGERNPRDVKRELAKEIVSIIYNKEIALAAESLFCRVFQDKKTPIDMPSFNVSSTLIVDILTEIGFAGSKSEARRVIAQGGVKVDDKKVVDYQHVLPEKFVLKKGKRHFANITIA